MLYYLHRVGAKRCEEGRTDCEDGCRANGSFNGTPPKEDIVTTPDSRKEGMSPWTKKDFVIELTAKLTSLAA